jgi:hypothetical protein
VDAHGYAVVPSLDHAAVAALRWTFERLGPPPDLAHVGVQRSDDSAVESYRTAVDRVVRPALADLGDVRAAAFGVTWPGERSGVGLHRAPDHEVVVALDDAADGAGEIWVVPDSHRWRIDQLDDLAPVAERLLELAVPVQLAAGQGVALHADTLRCSTPIPGDRPRLAVHATVDGPKRRRRGRRVRMDGSATPHERLNPPVAWCRRCGTRQDDAPVPHRHLGRVVLVCEACMSAPVPAWVELDLPGPPRVAAADVSTVTSEGWVPSASPTGSPVLVDPDLDDRLRRDGYVRLPAPVLTAEEAADLRAGFGTAHGWDGDGFHNAFNDRDRTYRERADALVREALDHRAAGWFTGHQPFIRPYLCKYPGEAGYFEPHRDWMYVDEREGAQSFVFFVALEDIDADNGQLLMLPGSHHLDDMLRGTHLQAPWLRHHDLLREHMVPLALKAGEGAIWNHALVHGSEPNRTDRPRLAAGLWVRSTEDPLVHFRRLDEATSARFEVDDGFFEAMDPYVLMVTPPRRPAAGVVPVGGTDLTESELSERLGAR